MESIKNVYKIGNGPSSSHTMGPKNAAQKFKETYKDADQYIITLCGSLALTGKGHLTDWIIKQTLKGSNTKIIFDKKSHCNYHPNTMILEAYKNDEKISEWEVYSIGGGDIEIKGQKSNEKNIDVYDLEKMTDIQDYCNKNKLELIDYIYGKEDATLKPYLQDVWNAMQNAIHEGLEAEGIIPGKLGLNRKAKRIYNSQKSMVNEEIRRNKLITSYAYAVSEQNASGGVIVTAPTCGSCGILPAVLYYAKIEYSISDEKIINALAIAGLIGNLVKKNASVSGAECGCQAEVGTACSMAAAAYAYIMDYSLEQIEEAAEIGMEHHLGLTCDPILGYVQIPCIERNAVSAIRAIDAANLAFLIDDGAHIISFDTVVDTMYQTGKDLGEHYRETSKGGLAKKYVRNKFYNPNLSEDNDN